MFLTSFISLAALICGGGSTPVDVCLASPAIQLVAGKSMGFMSNARFDGECEASIVFMDERFLPLRYSFDALQCEGQQWNSFDVPKGVPNGDVEVVWQCSGAGPVCSRAVISEGSEDSSFTEGESTIGCVSEVFYTTTATQTVSRGSSTSESTLTTILTSLTTSFLPQSSEATLATPKSIITRTKTISMGTDVTKDSSTTGPSLPTGPSSTQTTDPDTTTESDKEDEENESTGTNTLSAVTSEGARPNPRATTSSSEVTESSGGEQVTDTPEEPDAIFQSSASSNWLSFTTLTISTTLTTTLIVTQTLSCMDS